MSRWRTSYWLLALLPLMLIGSATLRVNAQRTETRTEEITLPVGSMFEIYADAELKKPSFSWVLTQDRTFLQAGTERIFRVRLTKAGTYILDAEARSQVSDTQYKQRFLIDVRDPAHIREISPINTLSLLKRTWPVRDDKDRLILGAGNSVIRLEPDPGNTQPLQLDLDANRDSNGDGNARNDQQVSKTFFSSKSTPLHVWFTEPPVRRTMILGLQGGTLEEVQIRSPQEAENDDEETARLARENEEISLTDFGRGKIGFVVNVTGEQFAGDPLLLHWSFGDGQQSLLDRPIHTYAENGTYDVSVRINNLRTGEELKEFVSVARVDTALPPQPIDPPDGQEPPPPDEPEPPANDDDDEPEPPAKPSGDGFALPVKLILVAVLSVLAGFAVMFLIGVLKRKGALQNVITRFENKLLNHQKDDDKDTADAAPPLVLTEEEDTLPSVDTSTPEATDVDVVDTVATTAEAPAPSEPGADAQPAETPDWLQQGMEQASATGQTADSPPPATLQETAPAAPADTVAPQPEASPAAAAPDWLQADQPATPAASDTQPPPTPAPAADDSSAQAPAWLQSSMDQATTTGQTADNPPPPALQDSYADAAAPGAEAPAAAEPAAPAPDWLQATPAAEPAAATSEPAAGTPEPPAPAGDSQAPAWLQTGMDQAAATGQTADSPPPASLDDSATSISPEPAAPAAEPLPDWLQGSPPAAPATDAPAASAQEAPAAPVQEAPAAPAEAAAPVTPAEPPPAAPATDDATPAWLQAGAAASDQAATPEAAPAADQAAAPEATPAAPGDTEQPAAPDTAAPAEPLPDWLQSNPASPEPAAPAAEATTDQAATPEPPVPAPESEAVTEPPAPAAESADQPPTGDAQTASEAAAPLPDWLQAGSTPTGSGAGDDGTAGSTATGDDAAAAGTQSDDNGATAGPAAADNGAAAQPPVVAAATAGDDQAAAEVQGDDAAQAGGTTEPAAAKTWEQMTPEEKEKERKRQKRKRYRQNKKERLKKERSEKTAADTAETEPAAPEASEAPAPAAPEANAEPATVAEATTPEQDVPQATDEEVQFLIRADSIEGEAPADSPEEEPPGNSQESAGHSQA